MSFVESLVPMDQDSLTCLTSVKTSIIIKEVGGEQLPKMLRIVKRWAINRQIYGQNHCFFGGISMSILCAKAIQMIKNPEANIDELLAFFFKLFAKWDWSNPVSLIENQKVQKGTLITILTPTDDPINSSENIIQSQYNIIVNEFNRAHKIFLKF